MAAVNNEIEISASEARALVDRIKTGVEVIGDLIVQAYTSRAWLMLGYASWDEMCTREFGTSRLRIPREERSETVASLRESGLSIRAIAAATGESKSAIDRELGRVPNGTPDPQPVTGIDGKTYTPKPRPRPVVDPQPDDRFISADDLDELNASPPELDEPELPFDQADSESELEFDDPQPIPVPEPIWSEEELTLRKQMEAGHTVVVSLRAHHANLVAWATDADLFERIDRKSIWGNPFLLDHDGDRDAVISKYETHYLPFKPSLLAVLDTLRGKALGCWCAPEPCHGDILKKLVES